MSQRYFKITALFIAVISIQITAFAVAPLNSEALKELASQYTDRDAFVDRLLELYPNLTATQALVYRSRSPEKASVSAKFPRVLLGTPDGSIFLAFTSDPNRPGSNIIQFIDQTTGAEQFEFSESKLAKPIVSKPESCQQCHGTDGRRLIFDSYVFWPGIFGSNELYGAPKKELTAWKKYLKETGSKGLYKKLIDSEHFIVEGEKVEGKHKNDPKIQLAALGDRLGNFSDAVVSATMRRIGREIKAHPRYPELRYALYAASLGCDNFQKLLPSNFTAKKPLAEVQVETMNQLKTYHANRKREYEKDKMKNYIEANDASREHEEIQYAKRLSAKLRYIMEGVDVKTDEWSSTLDLGSFAFESADVKIFDIATELALPGFEPKEINRFALGFSEESNLNNQICSEIEQKFNKDSTQKIPESIEPPLSHRVSTPAEKSKGVPSSELGKTVFASRCLQCHSKEDNNGLDFTDLESLRKSMKSDPLLMSHILALTDPDLPRVKRMPKTGPTLTDHERQSLKIYLENLAGNPSTNSSQEFRYLPEPSPSKTH
jgi:hypothetical protein